MHAATVDKYDIPQLIDPRLITREQAAVLLGCSLPTVINLTAQGVLREYRIAPKIVRLNVDQVRDVVASRAAGK